MCIAFIPNAFNTADGANGLVAGVSAFSFMALITVAPATLLPFLLACLVGCLVFLVFNLISSVSFWVMGERTFRCACGSKSCGHIQRYQRFRVVVVVISILSGS